MRTAVKRFKAWTARHFFFLIAVATAYFVLFEVPQVAHLWQQIPRVPGQWLGFLALLAVLAFLYGTSLWAFWQMDRVWRWRRERHWRLLIFKPALFTLEWLNVVARSMRILSRGVLGYVGPILVAVAGMAMFVMAAPEWNGIWFLAGGFFRIAGGWLILVAVWLLVGKVLGPEHVTDSQLTQPESVVFDEGDRRTVWQSCGQSLGWFGIFMVLGELLWIAAAMGLFDVSLRLYSIWAIVHLAATLLLLAALLDYLEVTTPLPWRLIAAGIFAIILWQSGPERIEDARDAAAAVAAAPTSLLSENADTDVGNTDKELAKVHWLHAVDARLEKMPPGPVVLVSASGGGSRAALFTSLVLKMLSDEPFDLPSLDDPNTENAAEVDRNDTWGKHVLLISAVSGGSLATARYAQLTGQQDWPQHDTIDQLAYTDTSELSEIVEECLQRWLQLAREEGNDEAKVLERALQLSQDDIASAYMSRYVDEMCIDFMAPIVRGAMVPYSSRGQGLFYFWDKQFDWHDRTQASFAEDGFWDPQKQPLIFLNTCDIDYGRRVVLGFPRLPFGLLTKGRENALSRTANQYRPVSLSDLVPAEANDIGLARAVRLSSNFPFGFAVSAFPRVKNEAGKQWVHLLDGGVVDNTGLDSLHAVFEGLHNAAARNVNGMASRILGKLRKRGVVVLVIDSGAKPADDQAGSRLFNSISQPYAGLNAASYINALRTGDQFLSGLREILSDSARARLLRWIIKTENESDREPAEMSALLYPPRDGVEPLSVLTYQLTCNHVAAEDAYVMTAFALGPADKAAVVAQFLVQRERWRKDRDGFRDYFVEVDKALRASGMDQHVRYTLAFELLQHATEITQDLRDSDAIPIAEEKEMQSTIGEVWVAIRNLIPPDSELWQAKSTQFEMLAAIVRNRTEIAELAEVARNVQPPEALRREGVSGEEAEQETGDRADREQIDNTVRVIEQARSEARRLASSPEQSSADAAKFEAAQQAIRIQQTFQRESKRQAEFYAK